MSSISLSPREIAVLAGLGFQGIARAELLGGGANNQVLRIDAAPEPVVLKRYFGGTGALWDRFGAERSFYQHALRDASEFVPRPLFWDQESRGAVFQFVPGVKLASEAIDRTHIAAAAGFIERLNASPTAGLEPASDSAFSIEENVRLIGGRFERLAGLRDESPQHAAARRWAAEYLLPLWERHARAALAIQGRAALPVAPEERVASPSDFGFHNAVADASGRLRFFDFEYAGVDDLAKLVCDFFSQPAIPVPPAHEEEFVRCLRVPAGRLGLLQERIRLLRPLVHLKWCCIMLNDFLPEGTRRRSFALSSEGLEERNLAQLSKVQHYFGIHFPTGASGLS